MQTAMVMRSSKLEKIEQLEKAVLPLLMKLKGHEIHRYNRLQLALYALKDDFLPKYKFKSKNVWGPADDNLRRDLNYLCGLIEFDVFRGQNYSYGIYRLTRNGEIYGKIYLEAIETNPDKNEKLTYVVDCLKKHKEKSLVPLYKCLVR